MAKIFITGSSDGLGLLAGKALIAQGHNLVLHARNSEKAKQTLGKVPGVEEVITGDLSDLNETKGLASQVNALGSFDAIIHNAGTYSSSMQEILNVNVLAPYVLTCLIHKPQRLIYLSSDMHLAGHFNNNFDRVSYSDSKLMVLMLSMAVARRWDEVYANALNPGWVPTKMGGKSAPDDLAKGYETQVWLAAGKDARAKVSGKYFFHQRETRYNPEADDTSLQERFLNLCEEVTGVRFPD